MWSGDDIITFANHQQCACFNPLMGFLSVIIKSRLHSAWKGVRVGGEGRGEKEQERERETESKREREHNSLGESLASFGLIIRDLGRAVSQNHLLSSKRTE